MTTQTNSFGSGVAQGIGIVVPVILFGLGYLGMQLFDKRVKGVVEEMFEPQQHLQEYHAEEMEDENQPMGFHVP